MIIHTWNTPQGQLSLHDEPLKGRLVLGEQEWVIAQDNIVGLPKVTSQECLIKYLKNTYALVKPLSDHSYKVYVFSQVVGGGNDLPKGGFPPTEKPPRPISDYPMPRPPPPKPTSGGWNPPMD